MDDELFLGGIASLESSTPSNRANLQTKQSTEIWGIVSRIHKVKQNNALISLSMWFSAFVGIDGPVVNGILLVVEAFTVLFDHFFLILFLQRETNYKCDNTNNNNNVTKVCQELTSWAFATRVHNLSGFEGSLPLWPLFHTFIWGAHWPLVRSYGYELVTKNKVWMYFSN
jgi:hypothetical protein